MPAQSYRSQSVRLLLLLRTEKNVTVKPKFLGVSGARHLRCRYRCVVEANSADTVSRWTSFASEKLSKKLWLKISVHKRAKSFYSSAFHFHKKQALTALKWHFIVLKEFRLTRNELTSPTHILTTASHHAYRLSLWSATSTYKVNANLSLNYFRLKILWGSS